MIHDYSIAIDQSRSRSNSHASVKRNVFRRSAADSSSSTRKGTSLPLCVERCSPWDRGSGAWETIVSRQLTLNATHHTSIRITSTRQIASQVRVESHHKYACKYTQVNTKPQHKHCSAGLLRPRPSMSQVFNLSFNVQYAAAGRLSFAEHYSHHLMTTKNGNGKRSNGKHNNRE